MRDLGSTESSRCVSNAHYTMVVGVLAKPQAIKAVIRSDTAVVHAYENCELNDWADVK